MKILWTTRFDSIKQHPKPENMVSIARTCKLQCHISAHKWLRHSQLPWQKMHKIQLLYNIPKATSSSAIMRGTWFNVLWSILSRLSAWRASLIHRMHALIERIGSSTKGKRTTYCSPAFIWGLAKWRETGHPHWFSMSGTMTAKLFPPGVYMNEKGYKIMVRKTRSDVNTNNTKVLVV